MLTSDERSSLFLCCRKKVFYTVGPPFTSSSPDFDPSMQLSPFFSETSSAGFRLESRPWVEAVTAFSRNGSSTDFIFGTIPFLRIDPLVNPPWRTGGRILVLVLVPAPVSVPVLILERSSSGTTSWLKASGGRVPLFSFWSCFSLSSSWCQCLNILFFLSITTYKWVK